MHAQTRKITSGLEVEKPSDDPTSIGGIMVSSSNIRALDQYRDNLSMARSRLDTEDGILDQLSSALIRARELGVSQQGATASAETRLVAKEEIDGIFQFVRELGNTQFAGSFLFGGDYADTRPFPPGGPDPLKPPSGTLRVEGGSGAFLNVNHSGQEIFVDTGVFAALEDLSAGLAVNSEADILDAMTDLNAAFDRVQEIVGDLGGRQSQVDMALSNLDAMEVTLKTFRSDLQDVELEEALTELIAMQTTYEAALMANARIMSATLTDYLR
jgi:flagellar hook-associated protein 3 FlgL